MFLLVRKQIYQVKLLVRYDFFYSLHLYSLDFTLAKNLVNGSCLVSMFLSIINCELYFSRFLVDIHSCTMANIFLNSARLTLVQCKIL